MATMITSECINCGACEPECPNTAIYQGGVEWEFEGATHAALSADIFYIVPEKCTECVGFHDQEACAAVCPVDVCIPNPDIPETESQLLERARQLHPGTDFGASFPSRFRDESAADVGAEAAPTAGPATAPASAGVAPSAAPEASLQLPSVEDWDVPIDCHGCHGTYAVSFKHLRSGIVLRCPFCSGSYIVTSSMHGNLSRAMREFHGRWRQRFEAFADHRARELGEFEERQKIELEKLNEELKRISQAVKAPGAPRKRAGIFG